MTKTHISQGSNKGFTLIELSIVLVIIGLIVGGVLVGQDLIKAAEIRATVSQVEKYNTAVNVFRLKYNGLPGDLATPASFFSSVTSGNESAQGDGDGLIEGNASANTPCTLTTCIAGEAAVFWYMLNNAGLIPDAVTTVNYEAFTLTVSDATNPAARMGKGARFAIMSIAGINYYVIGNFGNSALTAGTATFTAAMTPTEALQLDGKLDDGKPASGVSTSIAVATALPGTAANGAVTASLAAGNCYDTTLAAYATGATTGSTIGCTLGIKTTF